MKSKLDDNYTINKKKAQRKALKILATAYLAKTDFWFFLKAMDSEFFTEEKEYLKDCASQLQHFHDCPCDECDTLILNMPPRSGKTYILELYEVWCKMSNPKSKSIIVCYNEQLSLIFSTAVRNLISTPKLNKYKLIPADIFPGIYIKRGSAAKKMWSLEQSSQINFLATSPGGTVTGMAASGGSSKKELKGGNIIIDDLVKSAYEAFNERILEEHWQYFRMTLFSRREKGSKLIICFTRWSPNDLVGKYEQWAKEQNKKYKKIIYKMEQEDGSPLHTSIMSKEEMEERKIMVGELIWKANYQQEPENIENKLYTHLYAYVSDEKYKNSECDYVAPKIQQFKKIYCAVDVADTGKDRSVAIAFGIDYKNNKIVILDVLYTQEKLELFQYSLVDFLIKNDVAHCIVEDNMGGSLFVGDVRKILRNVYKNEWTIIEPFTQGKSKSGRIFSAAATLQRLCRFPYEMFTRYEDGRYIFCENRQWKEYMEHMLSFVSVEDSEHDDAEDCTTIVVEYCIAKGFVK